MPRTFKTDEQAQNAVYFYLLNYSKSKHAFPDISRRVERKLKIDERTYNLNFRAIKEQVVRHRVDEILRKKDASIKEIQKELGIGIYNYLDALGYPSGYSDLFFAYRGKRTRRKFATREQALNVFRTEVEKNILNEQYKSRMDTENKIRTPLKTYDINWKEDVLDFVHERLIKGELEKNPHVTLKNLRKKYPFALETARRIGSFAKLKRKSGIIYKSHSNREELLESCVKAKRMFSGKTSFVNIQKEVGACLERWKITMKEINLLEAHLQDQKTTAQDINTIMRFINSMTGYTIEEKNKKLITYANLIRQLVKPKPEKTSEEDMWESINQEIDSPPNTFDVTNAKNYLLYMKEIGGGEMNGGYWEVE